MQMDNLPVKKLLSIVVIRWDLVFQGVMTSGKMNSQTQRISVEWFEVNMEVNMWLLLFFVIDF